MHFFIVISPFFVVDLSLFVAALFDFLTVDVKVSRGCGPGLPGLNTMQQAVKTCLSCVIHRMTINFCQDYTFAPR